LRRQIGRAVDQRPHATAHSPLPTPPETLPVGLSPRLCVDYVMNGSMVSLGRGLSAWGCKASRWASRHCPSAPQCGCLGQTIRTGFVLAVTTLHDVAVKAGRHFVGNIADDILPRQISPELAEHRAPPTWRSAFDHPSGHRVTMAARYLTTRSEAFLASN
jgi:hypothetical protein